MAVVLETVDLTHHFGQVTAAEDLNLRIETGERVGIVGPNGAGKTTFLNLITGHVKAEKGQAFFQGTDIIGLSPPAVTELGIARSFQVPQLFPSLTVLENLMLAQAAQAGDSLDFSKPLMREGWVAGAMSTLGQFGLRDHAYQPVNELPEGGLKLLDVALSITLKPQLLLMDEPTSGVSSEDKFGVMDTLMEILDRTGVTIVFVEHDLEVVQRYAERVLVFNRGRIVADGDPRTLLASTDSYRSVLRDK